ncbi:MAG TPA: hypothetical protein VK897_08820 [Anaerolineales bacterium]|nr:hypothetical protein [Anaerolineales bacterium]
MQDHYDVFAKDTGYGTSFKLTVERERLADHLKALRRITWDLRAKICQFEDAFEDMSDLKAEMNSLQDQINATAENLGLHFQE